MPKTQSFPELSKGKRFIAAVVAHTHWDRAWYHPFELFRVSLCRTFRRVLEVLENDRQFKHFSFDGQTVVVEDYLEIYPQDRQRVQRQVKAGRLTVGPWYVLPDLFLVTGEALVRNGLIGQEIAESFGRSSRQGYVADPFGLISQTPQIWARLGLESIFFSRGVSKEQLQLAGPTFWWAGPDGSRILGVFQVEGYSNIVNWGVPLVSYPHDDPDTSHVDFAAAQDRIGKLLEIYQRYPLKSKVLFFGDGNDHHPPQHMMPKMVAYCASHMPEMAFVQVDLDGFVKLVKQERPKLKTLSGEMHSRGGWQTLNGTLESRPYLKRQFDSGAWALEKYAEPLAALVDRLNLPGRILREEQHFGFAFNVGNDKTLPGDYPAELLQYAWKTLLRNAPHDDICGCSADATHQDAENRGKRVIEITSMVKTDALLRLARYVKPPAGQHAAQIVVFNPIHRRRALIERTMVVAANGTRFHLIDGQGRSVEAAISARVVRQQFRRWNSLDFEGLAKKAVEVSVAFEAELPPVGYATYYLQEAASGQDPSPRIRKIPNGMENASVRVIVHRDGSFDLLDKRNGAKYRHQNQLKDQGDAGDLYVSRLLPDGVCRARPARGRVRLVEQTPFRITYETQAVLPSVPTGLNEQRTGRAGPARPIAISLRFTLFTHSPALQVQARWNNEHREHRLTAEFPTGLKTPMAQSGSTWDIVEHAAPFLQASCRDFVTAAQANRRLTILSRSMHAYDGQMQRGRLVLGKSLLKANGFVSHGLIPHWAAPEGNCLRHIEQDYALLLGKPADRPESLARSAAEFVHPPLVEHVLWMGQGGQLPARGSMIEIDGPFELTAMKKSQDGRGMIVRLVNWSDRNQRGTVRFSPLLKVRRVRQTDLRERPAKRLPLRSDAVVLRARPREIITLEF